MRFSHFHLGNKEFFFANNLKKLESRAFGLIDGCYEAISVMDKKGYSFNVPTAVRAKEQAFEPNPRV